ncbi:hypothetical protein ED733_008703 [Metarhizium rileyi]|uniref:AA1-like domain-containing protein n=1 Tax=Metarhizium rileyi (strain RCEF 4871) TaxID=1649241 RepID=A0A5C6GLU1_METRR|nr:hypothetical protein ED733_008703 [Metarhizium rileyi]
MKITLLLASFPATLAAQLAYTPPAALAVKAKDPNNNCVLPEDYHVKDFTAITNDTGHSLVSYKLTFLNTLTNSSTSCQYGSDSKPISSPNGGGLPRYSCESKDVNFIWQEEPKKLTMIQKVCPDAQGQAEYEAAGSVIISLSCNLNVCQTNDTDIKGTFTSLNPTQNIRAMRQKRGVAWASHLANQD